MLKASAPLTQPTQPARAAGEGKRIKIVEAALRTLVTRGFSGTSAREIARIGGFNQALIFYHFGGVNRLLLAALDRTAADRMGAYREALSAAGSSGELLAAAARLYREDLESGHMTVLSELLAAGLSHPDLAEGVSARMEPWIELAEEGIEKFVEGSAFEGLVPKKAGALALVAFYLGLDLVSHLDREGKGAAELFTMLPMLQGVAEGTRR